jgi:nitrogen regulatory protein P-II 1
MKRIEAVFSSVHLEGVVERLRMIGLPGMTLYELRRQAAVPREMNYRGVAVVSDLEPAVRVDVVTSEGHAVSVINALLLVLGKTQTPDGWIYVSPVEEAIRIRTGETGTDAL